MILTNKDQPMVSVIIPCYKGEKFLSEAIDSVLSQTYQNFEIIVVDDGSPDDIRGVVSRYPQVKYIHQENQGVSVARNRGEKEGSGELLVFLDHDDRLLPNALEIGVNSLEEHPHCGMVGGFSQSIDSDGNLRKNQPRKIIETVNYETILAGQSFVPSAALMFRKTAFETINGFDASFRQAQDLDLFLRLAQKFPIYHHNQIIVEYRRHQGNASNNQGKQLQSCLDVLDSQWEFVEGNKDYEAAYRQGKQHWGKVFGRFLPHQMVGYLKSGKLFPAFRVFLLGIKHYPQGFVEYLVNKLPIT